MKPEWKGPVRLAAALFVLYLAVHYWSELSGLLLVALGAAFPLAVGAVAAYAVNILMSQYERWYFPRSQSRAVLRTRRPVCLLLAYASLAAIVVLLVRMILPELISCVGLLIQKVIPLIDELSLLIGENLTQEQLGQMVGVRRETIMRLEAGKYNPSLKLAVDISRVVEAPIEDIFIFDEP